MALDELAATIDKLKRHISEHRESIAANETRTRQVLIDPLLSALGWDVTDPMQVELEYDVRGKRADYALIIDSNPIAVIEAKRLGHQLVDANTMQVMNYANTAGIEYMVVTNGDEWNMYSVFERGAIEERVVMELRVSRDPAHVNALKALSLWRSNVGSGSEPVVANDPVLMHRENQEQIQLESDKKELTNGNRIQLDEGWLRLSDQINTNKGAPRPNQVAFPDGYKVDIRTWVALWIETAEWVVNREAVIREFRFGKNKQMIMRFKDEDFWGSHQLKNGLWVERNVDPRNVVLTSCQLLEHFEIDPGTVNVRFNVG